MKVDHVPKVAKGKLVRAYIAGPMTGYEAFNFPAFFEASEKISKLGYTVFNPASNDINHYGNDFLEHPDRFNPRETMEQDLGWICKYCDIMFMLPGWKNSRGSNLEHALATYLNVEIIEL